MFAYNLLLFALSYDPAPHCIDYEITIKTKKDKQDILHKINTRRDKVASGDIRSLPSAGNMIKMVWNEKLAISAQRWANQCLPYMELDFKDMCRVSDNVNVGQNIATILGESSGLSPAILADVWYMELLNINSTLVSRYRPSNQTHLQHYDYFTQLIWARSYQVGCGGVKFKEMTDKNTRNRTINRLVCNFAPEGNQIGQPVYIDGFPCSECPYNGICDAVYSSLCALELKMEDEKNNDDVKLLESVKNNKLFNVQSENSDDNITSNDESENADSHFLKKVQTLDPDDNATFDYFANIFHSVVSTEKTTSKKVITCKDIMPVDDFIEVFKNKLIKDKDLKELFITSKTTENREHLDNSYSDVSVADFMSKIYSKKEISTTVKPTEPDYSNSTLLADLVEAIIFRNNEKLSTTIKEDQNTNFLSYVSAIKIKAEFGKVQTNSHSTGHYFFPVEYDEEDIKETTEMFYDISSIAVSDIALEIEELKRNRGTKGFLEEILESEPNSDMVTTIHLLSPTTYYSNENGSYEFFEDSNESSQKKSLRRKKRSEEMKAEMILKRSDKVMTKYSRKSKKTDESIQLIYYQDLLKKIASDIGILKLNERFHCSSKSLLFPRLNVKLLLTCSLLTLNFIQICPF